MYTLTQVNDSRNLQLALKLVWLRANLEYIGQIHFAEVPGRHEPGTGEINFSNVFRAIYEQGDRYSGYVTAEYHPTDLSFRDLERVKQLATFEGDVIV